MNKRLKQVKTTPKAQALLDALKALREAQAVIRAERLRNNSGYLQSAGFRMRKHFFCAPVSDQSTPRGPVVPLSSMAPALVPSRPQRLT